MHRARTGLLLLVAVMLAITFLPGAQEPASAQVGTASPTVVFTDWLTVDVAANGATGTLDGVSVSLTGSDLDSGVIDGSETVFASPVFKPQIPASDAIGIRGLTGYAYTLEFSEPVKDPVLHVVSLASTLTFPGIAVTKVSGQSTFTVSGSSVTGALDDGSTVPSNDANGTIQLEGTYETVSFSATPVFSTTVGDGIAIQIGAREADRVPTSGIAPAGGRFGVPRPAGPHSGVDIAGGFTPVHAMRSGKVLRANCVPVYGWSVIIDHGEVGSGRRLYSLYGHMGKGDGKLTPNDCDSPSAVSYVRVSRGEMVSAGSWIGMQGESGRATGRHLHFALGHTVRPGTVDTQQFLRDVISPADCIGPSPYAALARRALDTCPGRRS